MNWAARDWCATYTVLVAVHPRASSSATMAPWRAVPPLPPYASSMPKPEQPKFGQTLYVVSREIAALVIRRGSRRERVVGKCSYRGTEELLFLS